MDNKPLAGKIAIFDLDNCLASDSWRLGFINHTLPIEDIYRQYHMMSAFDEAKNVECVDNYVTLGATIAIVTSRPEWIRLVTERWLHDKGIHYDQLIMRPNDDHRHSVELKPDLIFLNLDMSKIVIAFDDRHDVLQAYRDHGIIAKQLAIHQTMK